MQCPNDQAEMRTVQVSSHYGQTILLEQCSQCGGIWFDGGELFKAKQGEAYTTEATPITALGTVTPVAQTLRCPKDQNVLEQFHDDNFPAELIIERCRSCDGLWMNRGEFTQYQNIREQRSQPAAKTPEDLAFEASIEQLLAPHQTTYAQGVEAFGHFLSTPVNGLTLRAAPNAGSTSSQQRNANRTASVALQVLRTLMFR